MATKKQRRRRGKYEYVYVDDEGNEVEPPKAGKATAPAKASAKATASGGKAARGLKEVKPPSWPRAMKWAGVYAGFMLVFTLSTAKKGASPAGGVLAALLFGAVFVPAVYFMHRLQYRTYQRMLEKQGNAKRST